MVVLRSGQRWNFFGEERIELARGRTSPVEVELRPLLSAVHIDRSVRSQRKTVFISRCSSRLTALDTVAFDSASSVAAGWAWSTRAPITCSSDPSS